MYCLSKTIKNKTIFLKNYSKGTIETSENCSDAMQFESAEAANHFAKQSISTLTWRAKSCEKLQ